MAKYLVIVESPAKVKTIKKFLGSNYDVEASNGHVRDLPKSQLGIDVEHDFEPKYITIRGKGELLAGLRKKVKKADKIYLATDPDREGEAISWHLYQALKLEDKKVQRITFNEITKNAVKASLKEPRDIDMDLVNAQQCRRMLDRLVGYLISPLLWAKVKRGLSAGRVQSVALRIICDREAEIEAFIPKEYWTFEVALKSSEDKKPFIAKLKEEIHNRQELDAVLADLEGCEYVIDTIKRGERVKKAPFPFTTSTMQQDASRLLNFSTSKTMRIAQQLYEGVEIKGQGSVGVITYLRTDSVRVSKEAAEAAKTYITETYGAEYTSEPRNSGKKGGKVQDAHEAIRPTNLDYTPEMLKESLTREQYRLYRLIYNRFLASQMSSAVYETMSVKIKAGNHVFTSAGNRIKFNGFQVAYQLEEEKEQLVKLSDKLEDGMVLSEEHREEKQHFTQPSPHFTEASLVHALEELGIGRPSTYAPIITTLLARRYITKEGKALYVTELGEIVNRIMVDTFTSIVDVKFTANLESLLDMVEEGTMEWKSVISNFYPDLDEAVKKGEAELEHITIEDEVSDVVCELCGRNMVYKYGPHGKFLACPGFPDCRNTKPYFEKIHVPCPKCGKEVLIKKTKKGRKYYGCEGNPECDFMSWQKPSAKKCPRCGGYMVEKGNKLCCADQTCGYTESKTEEEKDR
ncbi:MAG: type I DNA topoisomerase [Lachnospiraceae bacterium]|nr:type I DNA topoisomerase [Lachnospiraceae bacterium]